MKIRLSDSILEVSKGAYFALFKPQGWTPEENTEKREKTCEAEDFTSNNDALTSKEGDEAEEIEVVLEDMSISQLKEYADEFGIKVKGTKEEIINTLKERLE